MSAVSFAIPLTADAVGTHQRLPRVFGEHDLHVLLGDVERGCGVFHDRERERTLALELPPLTDFSIYER